MLVDHAEAETMRGSGMGDDLLAVADDELPAIGAVIAHDAFDERRLAGAVLAEERMHRAGRHAQRHVVEHGRLAEALRHVQRLEAEAAWRRRLLVHGSPSSKVP